MSEWYGVDMSKLSLRECWNFSTSPLTFLILLGLRMGGPRLIPNTAVTRPKALRKCEPADVAEPVRVAIDAVASRLQAEGFRPVAWWVASDVKPADQASGGHAMLSSDGRILAGLLAGSMGGRAPEGGITVLSSRLVDGTILATTDMPRKLDPPPGPRVTSKRGASLADLLAAHRRTIEGRDVVPFHGAADVEAFLLEREQAGMDHGILRGRYVPLSDAEVAAMRARLGIAAGREGG